MQTSILSWEELRRKRAKWSSSKLQTLFYYEDNKILRLYLLQKKKGMPNKYFWPSDKPKHIPCMMCNIITTLTDVTYKLPRYTLQYKRQIPEMNTKAGNNHWGGLQSHAVTARLKSASTQFSTATLQSKTWAKVLFSVCLSPVSFLHSLPLIICIWEGCFLSQKSNSELTVVFVTKWYRSSLNVGFLIFKRKLIGKQVFLDNWGLFLTKYFLVYKGPRKDNAKTRI